MRKIIAGSVVSRYPNRLRALFPPLYAVLGLLLALTGCGGSSDDGGKTTLRVALGGWMLTEYPVLPELAKGFEANHPGIRVEYCRVEGTNPPPYLMQFRQKRTDHDLLLMSPDVVDAFAASKIGALVEMPSKIAPAWWDGLLPPAVAESKRYGNQTVLPYLAEVMVLIYNKSLLAQAGIEKPCGTWEELEDQARIIKDRIPGKTPVAVRLDEYSDVYWFTPTVLGFCGTTEGPDGWPLTQGPAVEKSLAMVQRWVKNGYCNGLGIKDTDIFRSGDAAYIVTWASRYAWAAKTLGAEKIGIAPLPGGRAYVSFHFGSVPVFSSDAGIACAFLTEVMLSDRMQSALFDSGKMAIRKKDYLPDRVPDWIAPLRESLETGYNGPSAPVNLSAMNLVIHRELQAVAAGAKTPAEAMEEMTRRKADLRKKTPVE